MEEKRTVATQYIDGYTTAERSIRNTQRLDNITNAIQEITNVVKPDNLLFADGSLVSTQETRAEDIISAKDLELSAEIITKVSKLTYNSDQAAQDALIASNTASISTNATKNIEQDGRLTAIEGVNTSQQSQISNLIAADVALAAVDANFNTRITNNADKNVQQDVRLDVLESNSASAQRDYSIFTATGTVDTTVRTLKPTISTDFNADYNLADNVIDGTTLELTTTINYDAIITTDFYFNATTTTNAIIDLTVELYNVTTASVIDKAVSTMDFNGTTIYESGTRTNLGQVAAGDIISVRVYTDSNSVTITKSGMNMKVETIQGANNTTYDYDVVSTSNVGQVNTQQDINFLYNIDLQNSARLDALEAFDAGVQGMINSMAEMLVPVGTIQLGVTAPTYGTWTDLGLMAEGQAIIGGSTTDGEIKSHNHATFSRFDIEKGSDNGDGMTGLGFLTYWDAAGEPVEWDVTGGGDGSKSDMHTEKVGGSQNKAYGLGIGLDIHIWKRTA